MKEVSFDRVDREVIYRMSHVMLAIDLPALTEVPPFDFEVVIRINVLPLPIGTPLRPWRAQKRQQ